MADVHFLIHGGDANTARSLDGPAFSAATVRTVAPGAINGVAFSPDGQYLAVGHNGSPYLRVIRTSDWSEVGTLALPGGGYSVAFSPDGQFLAVAHAGSPYLRVIRTSDWSTVSGTPTLAGTGNGCSFSPDGQYLAVAHAGSPYLRVIRTSDWSTVSGTPTLAGTGNGCSFSPDGQYLAVTFNSSPQIRVYRTSDWSTVSGTPTLPSTGTSCAFSPDGQFLAAAHAISPFLRVIRTSDWSVVSGTPVMGSATGRAVAWLPDIDPPRRAFTLLDHNGQPMSLPVHLMRRPEWARSQIVTPNAVTGAFTVWGFASGDYHLLIPDTRLGATEDKIVRISLDATTKNLDALPVFMPYPGAPVTLSGNATRASNGSAVDEVLIRAWSSQEPVARAVPASNGDWSAQVPPGEYDITFRAAGCAPVCHGPYTVLEP